MQVWPRLLFLECRLRSCQPGGQQPEGRAGYIVEPDLVAELEGLWIAAMLATDANLEVGSGVASLGRRHLHQQAGASLVKGGEGILFEDSGLDICRKEVVDVVTRDAIGGLRQIVGAEAEELGFFGDLLGGEGRARQFDHGAHHEVNRGALLLEYLRSDPLDDRGLVAHLLNGADQWNHDFEVRIGAMILDVDRGLKYGALLHFRDLRERDAETAAAQTEHGFDLVQLLDPRQ